MSRLTRCALPALLLAFLTWPAVPVAAGDNTKVVRGIVTSIGADSLAISLPSDTDVTFRVDAKTRVIARGAGTKMLQARTQGASGVTLAEVLPIGSAVEVSYEERDGRPWARRVTSIAPAAVRPHYHDTTHAKGTVALVRGEWITIKSDNGDEVAFRADNHTRVVGAGFGTKAAARGGKIPMAELLNGGDRVRVTYADRGQTLHAKKVRLVSKATTR